jgi:pilus retraction protein PilT
MELFKKILKTAVDGNASDVHIKIGAPVIFRINRELISIECPMPTEQWMNAVVEKVCPIHLKKKLEEDREVDFSYYVPEVGRFRTNLFQQRGQWALAMRYVRSHVASFEELGLLDQVKTIAESPRGIVLVAGSTGSGKSTTLAAMIEHINSNFKRHVITLEDPIEFVFEDNQSVIEQREIGLDTSSFHQALKNVLRQDPDIIMLGEMRDDVSFSAAMSAADTGHLVLSTLHTNDSPSAITRLLELGVPAYLIRATLIGVLAQRLVRTLCPDCKATMEMTREYWSQLGVGADVPMPDAVCRAVGCLECRQTGYKGRSGVYELMLLTAPLQAAIADNPDLQNLRRLAIQGGMHPLRHAAARKIAAGLTTIDEVLALTPDPRDR